MNKKQSGSLSTIESYRMLHNVHSQSGMEKKTQLPRLDIGLKNALTSESYSPLSSQRLLYKQENSKGSSRAFFALPLPFEKALPFPAHIIPREALVLLTPGHTCGSRE